MKNLYSEVVVGIGKVFIHNCSRGCDPRELIVQYEPNQNPPVANIICNFCKQKSIGNSLEYSIKSWNAIQENLKNVQ
jgi:hypothetical protein